MRKVIAAFNKSLFNASQDFFFFFWQYFCLFVSLAKLFFSLFPPTSPLLAPVFDYEDIPSPLSESETTITVLLRPALGRGAPVRYKKNMLCTYAGTHSVLLRASVFIAAVKKSSVKQRQSVCSACSTAKGKKKKI